jgi:hypothetical protein
MPTKPQALIPYLIVAALAFVVGQGIGRGREEYRLRVIETTFLNAENSPSQACVKAFEKAKENPNYELLADPYHGLHQD